QNSSSRVIYRHRKHKSAKSDADIHLGQQSVVTNSEEGIHISVASIAFAEQYSQLKTVHDVFEHGCSISKFLSCVGTRNNINESYSWLTYTEVNDKVRAFGSGLCKIAVRKPDCDNIIASYGRNSAAWLIAQHACAAYSYVFLPLYEALDMGTLNLILKQTQPLVILCYSAKEAESVVRYQSVNTCLIIVRESEDADRLRGEYADRVKMFYFEEFLKQGTSNLQPKTLPDPDDLAMVCYTSGNTGIPKGVKVTHQQMVDSFKAAIILLSSKVINQETVYLSCLPLAFMLEQLITCVILLSGGKVAFLTGDSETISVDAKAVKPTIMLFVPVQLTRIYVDYYKNVPKTSCVRNLLDNSITHINNEQARLVLFRLFSEEYLSTLLCHPTCFFENFELTLVAMWKLLFAAELHWMPNLFRSSVLLYAAR
ncbi:long-chain acyl-CoA synthetase, partial [Paragonimus westermani]